MTCKFSRHAVFSQIWSQIANMTNNSFKRENQNFCSLVLQHCTFIRPITFDVLTIQSCNSFNDP